MVELKDNVLLEGFTACCVSVKASHLVQLDLSTLNPHGTNKRFSFTLIYSYFN